MMVGPGGGIPSLPPGSSVHMVVQEQRAIERVVGLRNQSGPTHAP
jgi:hypothetical protein